MNFTERCRLKQLIKHEYIEMQGVLGRMTLVQAGKMADEP
jgi:hypothetical protein